MHVTKLNLRCHVETLTDQADINVLACAHYSGIFAISAVGLRDNVSTPVQLVLAAIAQR